MGTISFRHLFRPGVARLTLMVVVLLTAGAYAADKPHPQLTGTWKFNPGLSDQRSAPVESSKRVRIGPGRAGPIAGGPIGGAGAGGPMIGAHMDAETLARSREITRIGVEAPDSLTIEGDEKELILTSGSGHVSRLRTDGSKVNEVSEGGLKLERKSKWDDEKLVTQLKAKGGGGEVRQTFTLDGDRLVVESTIESDTAARPLKLRHVYDKDTSE